MNDNDRHEAELEITPHLDPDESLLWAGKPMRGLKLRPADAFLIPFSLLWGGFAIFWVVAAIVFGAPWIMVLFGIPFVLVGLQFMIGRFFTDAKRRAVTVYALTDKRVLIMRAGKKPKTTSVPFAELGLLDLHERPDGSGSIHFGKRHPFSGIIEAMPEEADGVKVAPSFELLWNVREVADRIEAARG